jgi:hypothetical protein
VLQVVETLRMMVELQLPQEVFAGAMTANPTIFNSKNN